jgi:hypothetical protein
LVAVVSSGISWNNNYSGRNLPNAIGIKWKSPKKNWNTFFQYFGGRQILPEESSKFLSFRTKITRAFLSSQFFIVFSLPLISSFHIFPKIRREQRQ